MFSRRVAPGIEIRFFEINDAEPIFAVVERNRAYLREWLPWGDFTASPYDLRRSEERRGGANSRNIQQARCLSDWSSDVCSSDLCRTDLRRGGTQSRLLARVAAVGGFHGVALRLAELHREGARAVLQRPRATVRPLDRRCFRRLDRLPPNRLGQPQLQHRLLDRGALPG